MTGILQYGCWTVLVVNSDGTGDDGMRIKKVKGRSSKGYKSE